MDRQALFLDRDGVINEYRPYVHRVEEFHFVDGIFDLVAAAGRVGYLTIVVTNQAGIGRGLYTEEDFWQLTTWMTARFADRGCRIDRVFFCPTHPEHGIGPYRVESEFRKPRPGMMLEAAREFAIDLSRSVLVGDMPSDIAAGRAAGVGTNVLYRHGATVETGGPDDARPCLTVTDLRDVIPVLEAGSGRGTPPRRP
jgi:D-glycero-D-manno-heptose 1,7-bisphosphate phosphatase